MACSRGRRKSASTDMTTVLHQVAAEVAGAQLHRGASPVPGCSVAHPAFVDAPVSGGVTGASAATLSFMARPW